MRPPDAERGPAGNRAPLESDTHQSIDGPKSTAGTFTMATIAEAESARRLDAVDHWLAQVRAGNVVLDDVTRTAILELFLRAVTWAEVAPASDLGSQNRSRTAFAALEHRWAS